jgi:hypothetical protein
MIFVKSVAGSIFRMAPFQKSMTKDRQRQEIGVKGAFEGESSAALVRVIESCAAQTEGYQADLAFIPSVSLDGIY